MQDTAADEEKPAAAEADTKSAPHTNGDKTHTEAPAAEDEAGENGAAEEAEQDAAAQKAALAAGNGTLIMSTRLGQSVSWTVGVSVKRSRIDMQRCCGPDRRGAQAMKR